MAEKIQVLGPNVHQDVLIRLNGGCESSRCELETQLCGMGDLHGQLARCMQQFTLSVDTKLAQNDPRNDTQDGTIKGLCAEMQNLGVPIGKNHRENALMYQKVTKVERQMECIGYVIEGEVSQSFGADVQIVDVKMREGTKADATLSREPSKSGRSAKLPPCLALGQDNRRLGVGTKREHPPETEKGKRGNSTLPQ